MKMYSLTTILFLILFSFVSAPAALFYQQEDSMGATGTEKPVYRKSDSDTGNACYVYKQYVVMTASSEDVGEDIKIYRRSTANGAQQECANTKRAAYITIKNEGENFFFGLTGDKILIDSGTSAGIRGLEIFSLATKKSIYSTSYQDEAKVVGNAIIYNKPSNTKGALKNCPNAAKWKKQGGGVGWVIPTKIDLTTLKETKAGVLTCVYVE